MVGKILEDGDVIHINTGEIRNRYVKPYKISKNYGYKFRVSKMNLIKISYLK